MSLDSMATGELIQHAVVTIVAIAALVVVLRKVLGVFDKRQAGAPAPGSPSPTCSHCPQPVRRDGSPSRPK